jgi:Flp pilus assembly protein TadD
LIVPKAPTQHYEVLKELGDCHAAAGDFDRARQCYLQAAQFEAASPAHHIGLGVVAMLEGKGPEARQAFETAGKCPAAGAEAWWGLAMVHQLAAEHPQACAAFVKSLELKNDHAQALAGLIRSCRETGDFAPAERFVPPYLDRHPGDTVALTCQGELQIRQGQVDLARQTILNVLTLDPQNAQAAEMLKAVSSG